MVMLNRLKVQKLLGEFIGKPTGNHRFSHEIWDFPVIFPLNQSIEKIDNYSGSRIDSFFINGHLGTDSLEIPTIYKAYFSGLYKRISLQHTALHGTVPSFLGFRNSH